MTISLSTPAGHHYSPEVLRPRCYVQGVSSEVLGPRCWIRGVCQALCEYGVSAKWMFKAGISHQDRAVSLDRTVNEIPRD